jgi:hypothetical protein
VSPPSSHGILAPTQSKPPAYYCPAGGPVTRDYRRLRPRRHSLRPRLGPPAWRQVVESLSHCPSRVPAYRPWPPGRAGAAPGPAGRRGYEGNLNLKAALGASGNHESP